MQSWWYLPAMYGAYLAFMAGVRWLGEKVGPRLPARWQPLLLTPTGRTRTGRKALWIALALIALFYVALFVSGRALGVL